MRQIYITLMLAILCNSYDSHATPVKFEDWRHDKSCGHKLAEPVQTTTVGCESALCVNITDKSQVCACRASDDEDITKMTYRADGEVRLQWNSMLYPSGDTSAFRIDAADLNGDGKKELVIGMRNAVSNGMAVEHWNIRILLDEQITDPVDVEDYGTMGFLTSNDRQCRLLATRWMEGWDPVKGYGLYLVGRWMELSDGELRNTFGRPMIKRRYMKSLEQLRIRGRGKRNPLIWFDSQETSPIVGPYPFHD